MRVGGALELALQKYDVNVIGITLSRNQHQYTTARLAKVSTSRSVDIRLQGWEEFDEPVDRIVSIGAFEAFTKPRYAAFFESAHRLLPEPGWPWPLDVENSYRLDAAGLTVRTLQLAKHKLGK